MDLVDGDQSKCNGEKPLAVEDGLEGSDKGEENEEDGNETKSLLKREANGGIGGKRQRSSRRRVQWNDLNGDKLVEVLEFQPSDSSDSEDESGDSCICTIM